MEGQKSIHVHIKSPFSGTSTKRCRWPLNHSTIPMVGWLGAPEELSGGLIPWTRCVPIFGPALKRGEVS